MNHQTFPQILTSDEKATIRHNYDHTSTTATLYTDLGFLYGRHSTAQHSYTAVTQLQEDGPVIGESKRQCLSVYNEYMFLPSLCHCHTEIHG